MATIATTQLNRKTLTQRTNQIIRASKVLDFVKSCGLKAFEAFTGAYAEYQDVIGIRAGYFNKWAFIQTDANLSTAGTGLQVNNRQDVDKNWFQSFYFPMPNPDVDSNLDYFTTNYRVNMYKDKLLDEHFINESFAQLDNSLDLLYANRFIFGVDRTTTLQDGTTSTTFHYNGLKDLITTALTDTAITDIDSINVLGSSNCRNIDLSAETITDLNTFAQLNNLEWKMSNVNSVFALGNTTGGTKWINSGNSEIRYICWSSTIEHIKAKNYQFFKQLKELYDEGKLIKIVESTLDVNSINRTDTEVGRASPLSINPSNFPLPQDSILMYDANGIISFEYALDENGEEITINNITQTHKKIRMCRVSDFLPTTPIALVKVPALLNLSDNIQP